MKGTSFHCARTLTRTNKRVLEAILQLVCNHFLTTCDRLRSSDRSVDVVRARNTYCWLARRDTDATAMEIGALVNFSQTSTNRAVKVIESLRESDPAFRKTTDEMGLFQTAGGRP